MIPLTASTRCTLVSSLLVVLYGNTSKDRYSLKRDAALWSANALTQSTCNLSAALSYPLRRLGTLRLSVDTHDVDTALCVVGDDEGKGVQTVVMATDPFTSSLPPTESSQVRCLLVWSTRRKTGVYEVLFS